MNDEILYRYIASYKDVLKEYREGGLYHVQKKYSHDTRALTFHPITFFSSNIEYIYENSYIKGEYTVLKYNGKIYYLLYKKRLSSKCLDSITNLYIEGLLNDLVWNDSVFDIKGYYSQYYYEIESYYSCMKDSKPDKFIDIFYIEYGYINNLLLSPVDGYMYLANIEDVYEEKDDKSILQLYFEDPVIFKFDPGMYIASNWEKLKMYVGVDKCIYERKAIKHYLNHGKKLKYSYEVFDMYKYLANDIRKIDEIMRDKNGLIKYDIVRCNPKIVSRMFIKNDGVILEDKFDPVEFVKMYISDDNVNYDKNLSISNAHIYFVKGYINYDIVRWRTTLRFKILNFIKNRIFDGVRQTPVHLGKHLFKSCLF